MTLLPDQEALVGTLCRRHIHWASIYCIINWCLFFVESVQDVYTRINRNPTSKDGRSTEEFHEEIRQAPTYLPRLFRFFESAFIIRNSYIGRERGQNLHGRTFECPRKREVKKRIVASVFRTNSRGPVSG